MRRCHVTAGHCLALVAALLAPQFGCDSLSVQSATEVRVENGSALTFTQVSYWAGNQEVSYADLEPGETTPYVSADGPYGYTTVQVTAEGETLRLQVIDYVGETPLESGRYTYVLTVDGDLGARSLGQRLRKDP